jgi:phosphotransferase system enzyme I (PtsI)
VSRVAFERQGIAASPGIAIGPAYVLRRERLVIPEYRIDSGSLDDEIERLRRGFREARSRLREVRSGIEWSGLVGNIFDAQFLFLEDPMLIEHAERGIREDRLNAEWALQRELRRLEAMFESISDPYIRGRSSDVSLVVRRVLQALMGRDPEGLENAPPGVVVVCEDLSPAELAHTVRGRIAGIVTATGSRTSHVAIIARSLEIPAVVGAGAELLDAVADGLELIVDGRTGLVLIDPDDSAIAEYRVRQSDYRSFSRRLLRFTDLPAETRDGIEVRLMANVDMFEEIPDALRYGAQGIGLCRTEFLFMGRTDLPDEEEQFAAYRKILEAVAPREAVIRTLDLGGEKVPSVFRVTEEPNPSLGLRGVRLSLAHPAVFRVQLRALLRASAYGRLKILLPMITELSELRWARAELADVHAELVREGHRIDPRVELGAMIETPAAAAIPDLIAPQADFLSIGTNDLLQYTLAVDRGNDQVAYLYEPLHPAHLRTIRQVTQAARRSGVPVEMCGEMAADPVHTWILLALGVSALSMAPFSIPFVKQIVRDSTLAEARELYAEICRLSRTSEIRARVEARMAERFPVEFERIATTG